MKPPKTDPFLVFTIVIFGPILSHLLWKSNDLSPSSDARYTKVKFIIKFGYISFILFSIKIISSYSTILLSLIPFSYSFGIGGFKSLYFFALVFSKKNSFSFSFSFSIFFLFSLLLDLVWVILLYSELFLFLSELLPVLISFLFTE